MADTVRFAEVRKILEGAGYRLFRVRGSHHVFGREGRQPVIIPVHHGKVKAVYLRLAQKAAEEENQGDA